MRERQQIQMLFHGALVLSLGLLLGLPFGVAVTGGWGGESVQAWRVAHVGMVAVGLMLIAIGAAFRHLVLGQRETPWLM